MKQVKCTGDTFGVGKCANSWTGRADPLRKRGEDVLMVMKMAKSTPVLINGGSFRARNLFAGISRTLSGNPFHDFDSRFRLYARSFRITVCISGGCINKFNIFLRLVRYANGCKKKVAQIVSTVAYKYKYIIKCITRVRKFQFPAFCYARIFFA